MAVWLAQGRLPGPPGPLLLRRGHRKGLLQGHRGGALQGVSVCRCPDLGHQRRGHARAVGVPGRAVRGH